MSKIYFLIVLVFCLSGCTTATQYHPVNSEQLAPLAAEFVMTTSRDNSPTQWRIMRDSNRVELFRHNAEISEIWSKTSQDLWFYQKVFAQEQQVIEYSPADLAVLGVQPQWLAFALGIDPTVLAALPNVKSDKLLFGYKTQRLRGSFAGADYDVLWIPELALAARVKCKKNGTTTITNMIKPYSLTQAPWSATNTSGYRVIEYSDLGDMERDPFVKKVQGQIVGHAHSH